jgi:TetR/AcrR family transcriptional regulator, regulator of autoinduction and epiphytic fitness
MIKLKTNYPERELSPEKSAAILSGAMQEFLSNGYAATSMDKVATTAGVSKATVYSHFQDKENLFKAITQHMAREKCPALDEEFRQQSFQEKPEVFLRNCANQVLDSSMRDTNFLAFVRLVIGESGRFPELARIFVSSFHLIGCQCLSDYLASQPQLNILDPEATARVFIGSVVNFLIVQEIMHGKDVMPMECDRFIDSLVYLILRG